MSGPKKNQRTEVFVGLIFLLLASLFIVEVNHYFATGEWVLHGGLGAFSRWPMAATYNLDVWMHAAGMLAWMGFVVHQLATRGSGAHKLVGWIGAIGVTIALFAAMRPLFMSRIPALHGALGLTLLDWALFTNLIGIVEELFIGVYKVRRRDIVGHRQHLMTCVMWTVGPAVYRVHVRWMTELLDLGDPAASVWQTTWVHEMGLALTVIVNLSLQFTPWFSGHLGVIRNPSRHDSIERGMAKLMMGLTAALYATFGLWIADLLMMWPGEGATLTRSDIGWFVLDFVR